MKSVKFKLILIIFFCMIVTACSAKLPAYDSKQAIANGDVVSVHGIITNLTKLDDFMGRVHNGENGSVTISTYTNEGNAIITTLNSNEKIIECYIDARRDKFSSKDDRNIMKYTFTKIDKEIKNNATVYFLTDDHNSGRMDIITVDSNNLKPQVNQAGENDIKKYKFAIYFVKDLSLSDSIKTDLDKLPLESEPIITEKDIKVYYWRSVTFKADESLYYDKLRKITKEGGTPFVLTANGERIYLGTFWLSFSSTIPRKEVPLLNPISNKEMDNELNKDGYNVIAKSNEIYLRVSAPSSGKDIRSDRRVYKALNDAGILKE